MRFRDNAFNETGYVLQRRTAGEAQPVELARLPAAEGVGSTVEYIDTQTVPGARYSYELYATGEAGRRSAAPSSGLLQPVVSGASLRGTLFETADFTNDPAVDGDPYELSGAGLDEDWGDGGPASLHSTDDFSVLLRGSFRPRNTDNTFYTASAGGIALKITDYETGQTVLDFNRLDVERDMPLFGFQDNAGRVNLRAGHLYGIEVRYVERSGTAGYRVGWNWRDDAGSLSWATLPLPLLFESPPPPGSPLPAFTGMSATTIGDERAIIHFQDTFATETAFELLRSSNPNGPFHRTGDRVPPGSTAISSYLPIWGDRYYYKVRVLQPEPMIPFVDSEVVEVLVPEVVRYLQRHRFDDAEGFNLSGSAHVADGRLRLTETSATATGSAVSTNLFDLDYDQGFIAEFEFQMTSAAGPTALSFFVRGPSAAPAAPHAAEVRFTAAPGGANLNSATFLFNGVVRGEPVAIPTSSPDLDFDRLTSGGTLPPRLFRAQLHYLNARGTLTLILTNAANPAEKFEASVPVRFDPLLDGGIGRVGFSASAGDGGARTEVLNFHYNLPSVAAIYVRGSTWLGHDNNPATTTFMEYLETKGFGDDVFGYRVDNLQGDAPLPWINVDQIVVVYYGSTSTDQIPYLPSHYLVTGQRNTYTPVAVTQVVASGQPSGQPTFSVRLNKPLGGGDSVTGEAPSASENGDRITLNLPGLGYGGTNFSLTINVLQGDTDHLGETGSTHAVLARDFAEVKKRFFKGTFDVPVGDGTDYSPFHDVDGSGAILARDFAEVKKRFFQSLPPPPPAAAAAALFEPPISVTSDLFGEERVLS